MPRERTLRCRLGRNLASESARSLQPSTEEGRALLRLEGTLQGVECSGSFRTRHEAGHGLHEPGRAEEVSDGDVVNDRCPFVDFEKVLGTGFHESRAEHVQRFAEGDPSGRANSITSPWNVPIRVASK